MTHSISPRIGVCLSIIDSIPIAETKASAVSAFAPSQIELPMNNNDVPIPSASPPSSVSTPSIIEDHAESVVDRSMLEENSIALSFLETIKSSQEAQTKYIKFSQELQSKRNDVADKVLLGMLDQMALMNNASKTNKSFKQMTTKLLLDKKTTDFKALPATQSKTTLGIWYETFQRTLKVSPWDINGTSISNTYSSHPFRSF